MMNEPDEEVVHDQLPSSIEDIKLNIEQQEKRNKRKYVCKKHLVVRAIVISIMIVTFFLSSFFIGFGVGRRGRRGSTNNTKQPATNDTNNSNNNNNNSENNNENDSNDIDIDTEPSDVPVEEEGDSSTRIPISKESLINQGIALQNGNEFVKGITPLQQTYQYKALQVLEDYGMEKTGNNLKQKLAQRYALLCLFFSTNRVRTDVTDQEFGYGTTPAWQVIDPWHLDWDSNVCTWYGIACDQNGLVIRIELVEHFLTGYVPNELVLLDDGPISVIDFGNNRGLGQGGFPTVFTKFNNLDYLSVAGCSFSGDVPDGICAKKTTVWINCELQCDCCKSCA